MQLKGKCSKLEKGLIDWTLFLFDCTERKKKQNNQAAVKKQNKTTQQSELDEIKIIWIWEADGLTV